MKMKRWLLGVVSFSAVFISACSSGGERQEEGNAAEEDEAINIGSMFELTGSASAYGNTQANAVQMAADEINDDGGIDGQQINIKNMIHNRMNQKQLVLPLVCLHGIMRSQ